MVTGHMFVGQDEPALPVLDIDPVGHAVNKRIQKVELFKIRRKILRVELSKDSALPGKIISSTDLVTRD